jgi:hypothetical protein
MVQDILKSWQSLSLSNDRLFFLYETRGFITMFNKACHWTLSWARWNQFDQSVLISLRSILMLSSHLRLDLPSGLLPSDLPTKTPQTSSPPHACHMSRPSPPPWFNHSNNIRWRIPAVKFITMQFSPRPAFIPFRSKYLQHSVLKEPQSVFLPQSERPSFTPIQYNWQNNSFVYFNL